MKILLVEDEASIAKLLRFNFSEEGYTVAHAEDGPTALEMFDVADPPFDLVVLDLMLPGMSGYQVCTELRERSSSVPVLILSARSLAEDRMLAFNVGSDQYMTKPFNLEELLARVRNLLARSGRMSQHRMSATDELTTVRVGDVLVDFGRFEVTRGKERHSLTSIECQLLKYFIEHDGLVLSRAKIMEDVWKEPSEITSRSIDNFVMRLRKLIEPADAPAPVHLLSVRGTGYRFVLDPEVDD